MQRVLQTHYQNFRYLADRTIVILKALERQAELEELIAWAQRKRLKRPLKHFQIRLLDEEQRLAFYNMRHPKLLEFCEWLRIFRAQIKGNRSGFKRGKVSKYRLVVR
jgi:hypothetical protein